MSCYEWECGEFKLSTVEYRKFRNRFVARYNEARKQDFETVQRVYAALIKAGKGKRGFNWKEELLRLLAKETTSYNGFYDSGCTPVYPLLVTSTSYVVRELMMKAEKDERGRVYHVPRSRPVAPKKMHYAPLPATKARHFDIDGEASVTFSPTHRTVKWSVSENNHAIERARTSFIGKLFFECLDQVSWTRGTGGYIYGNDEYHEAAARGCFGAGGSFLKECLGPVGEKAREDELGGRARRSSRSIAY